MGVDVTKWLEGDSDAFELGHGTAAVDCPVCEAVGVYVSLHGIAGAGPYRLDGYVVCATDDGVYYHHEDWLDDDDDVERAPFRFGPG